MQVLKGSSKSGIGRGTHSHVVYLNELTKTGASATVGGSKKKPGHSHEIQWVADVPADIDETTGEEIAPAQPGYWMMLPADDGHAHEIEEYELEEFKPEEGELEIVQSVYRGFERATVIERQSLEDGNLGEEFYFGDQWTETQLQSLTKDNRACLTLNMIQPKINELSGFEREQRTLWKYVPTEGGDQVVADALNVVTNVIATNCYYDREKSRVFEDAIIGGRGLYHIYVDRTKDLRGEIKVEAFPWRDVRFGPHYKEDLSDCEELFKHKMYAWQKVNQLWADKAESIKSSYADAGIQSGGSDELTTRDSNFDQSDTVPTIIAGTEMVDTVRKEYRVLEREMKVYFPTFVATNTQDKFYFNCLGWRDEDIKQIETIPGFVTIPLTVQKMRLTTVCGNALLRDEYPADVPLDDFSIVPVYGIKRGDRFQGKVTNAIDAQKELNVRHSQAVDIGNRHITAGWFYTSNTFPENEKKKFLENVSRAGFAQEITQMSEKPERVEGGVFPPMIVDLLNLSEQRINQLISVTVESQGTHDSGAKLAQLQVSKLKGSEHVFDNLAFAQQKVARLLAAHIQDVYTPERLYRILASRAEREQFQLNGQPFQSYPEEELMYLLQEADLTSLDIAVAEQTYSPTARLANFLLLSDLAGKGAPIPPESLIELMDAPQDFKTRTLQNMQAQQEAAAAETQKKYDTELQKTAMAQEAKKQKASPSQ